MRKRITWKCPVDGARTEHVVFEEARERGMVRERATRFANDHTPCTVGLDERMLPHRCGVCGVKLVFGDECPFHRASVRVRWTEEIEAAYRASVEAVDAGVRLSVPVGHQGDAFIEARRLMERWGRVA